MPQAAAAAEAAEAETAAAAQRFSRTVANLSVLGVCPISRELMVDPVLAEDGNTYEPDQIIAWLAVSLLRRK